MPQDPSHSADYVKTLRRSNSTSILVMEAPLKTAPPERPPRNPKRSLGRQAEVSNVCSQFDKENSRPQRPSRPQQVEDFSSLFAHLPDQPPWLPNSTQDDKSSMIPSSEDGFKVNVGKFSSVDSPGPISLTFPRVPFTPLTSDDPCGLPPYSDSGASPGSSKHSHGIFSEDSRPSSPSFTAGSISVGYGRARVVSDYLTDPHSPSIYPTRFRERGHGSSSSVSSQYTMAESEEIHDAYTNPLPVHRSKLSFSWRRKKDRDSSRSRLQSLGLGRSVTIPLLSSSTAKKCLSIHSKSASTDQLSCF